MFDFTLLKRFQLYWIKQKIHATFTCYILIWGVTTGAITGAATGAAATDVSDSSGLAWLKRINEAAETAGYQQIITYGNQTDVSTVQLIRAVINGHEYERLTFLDGPFREILRKDGQVTLLQPEQQETGALPRLPSSGNFSDKVLDSLSKYYHITNKGLDRIAGHYCIVVAVTPKDKLRFGYNIWVDKNTGVILRLDLIDEQEKTLDRFLVTKFQPEKKFSVEDFALSTLSTDKTVVSHGQPALQGEADKSASALPDGFPWMIWHPSGFEMAGAGSVMSPVSRKPVDHALYSDGLAAFSVYIEQDMSHALGQAERKFGATASVTRVFKNGGNAYYNITVVGELPLGVAERIAASVQIKDSNISSGR